MGKELLQYIELNEDEVITNYDDIDSDEILIEVLDRTLVASAMS